MSTFKEDLANLIEKYVDESIEKALKKIDIKKDIKKSEYSGQSESCSNGKKSVIITDNKVPDLSQFEVENYMVFSDGKKHTWKNLHTNEEKEISKEIFDKLVSQSTKKLNERYYMLAWF